MLMGTYWTALSERYQVKVKEIARKHNVDTQTVMRNLEGYLRAEAQRLKKPEMSCSQQSFTTMREMEALIDIINVRRRQTDEFRN